MLHASRCITRGHKICIDCWFGPGGFATEGGTHPCPGCINNLPICIEIAPTSTTSTTSTFIDLT